MSKYTHLKHEIKKGKINVIILQQVDKCNNKNKDETNQEEVNLC